MQIILKRFDPQIWLPTLTLTWGIVTIAQGLIKNKAGLFGIRFRAFLICEPAQLQGRSRVVSQSLV